MNEQDIERVSAHGFERNTMEGSRTSSGSPDWSLHREGFLTLGRAARKKRITRRHAYFALRAFRNLKTLRKGSAGAGNHALQDVRALAIQLAVGAISLRRLGENNSPFSRSGMGLATVYGIIRQHGGFITLQ